MGRRKYLYGRRRLYAAELEFEKSPVQFKPDRAF